MQKQTMIQNSRSFWDTNLRIEQSEFLINLGRMGRNRINPRQIFRKGPVAEIKGTVEENGQK
jgi:hypothetical protein